MKPALSHIRVRDLAETLRAVRAAQPEQRADVIAAGDCFVRDAGGTVVDSGKSSGPIRIRISDETKDRYDTIIRQSGWDLEAYVRNPVVLWMHNSWGLPIARSSKPELVDGALYAEPDFSEARKSNPLAGSVEDMIRAGLLNAASVGWRTKKWSYDEETEQLYFDEMELYEYSIVTVPGNPNALVEGRSLGIDVEPLLSQAEETMRAARGAGRWVLETELEQVARAGKKPTLYSFTSRVGEAAVEVTAPDAEGLVKATRDLGFGAVEPKARPAPNEIDADAIRAAVREALSK